MKNNLMIFEGNEIEILTKEDVNFEFNGECLFNGKQTCKLLEYSNDRDAISKHIRENQKVKLKNSDVINYNFRKLNNAGETFLKEDGVIGLIQRCNTLSYNKKQKITNWLIDNGFIENKIFVESRKEINFLDKLEQSLIPFNIEGIRQYSINGGKYRIDYYIPKLNIAIEYDKNGHKYYTYEQQKGRQTYIEKELGCKFIRISDKHNDEYNIGVILKEMFEIDSNIR